MKLSRFPLVPRRARPVRVKPLVLLMAAWALAAGDARAQAGVPRQHVQAGLGVVPGIGTQVGVVMPRGLYTVEGALYVDVTPPYAGGEGSVQASGGVGGAVRLFGILRALGSPGYRGRDVDVGLRFGPSLFFAIGESSRSENPFSLFFDPFVRLTTMLGGRRVFFAEVGPQRPVLRAGLFFDL